MPFVGDVFKQLPGGNERRGRGGERERESSEIPVSSLGQDSFSGSPARDDHVFFAVAQRFFPVKVNGVGEYVREKKEKKKSLLECVCFL